MLTKARAFVPGRPFQPSLMSAGKARRLLKRGATERFSTRVGSGLISKHLTRLERPASEKHSSVFGTLISYKENSFITIATIIKLLRSYLILY
jgi:hypothetical protein